MPGANCLELLPSAFATIPGSIVDRTEFHGHLQCGDCRPHTSDCFLVDVGLIDNRNKSLIQAPVLDLTPEMKITQSLSRQDETGFYPFLPCRTFPHRDPS